MFTFYMNYEEQTYNAGWIAVAAAWTIIASLKLASIYLSRLLRRAEAAGGR